MANLISIFVATAILVGTSSAQQDCHVTLPNGAVTGYITETYNSTRTACAYTGIPYATPPVGALRFQPPQPAPAWSGTLNATGYPNWCPQSRQPPSPIQMTEDCLQLSVYTPQVENVDPEGLPVLIWFHGGGFITGSSLNYTHVKFLAKEDIIYVSAHYRLGFLGFFSTGDEVVPGNMGFKDQAFVIRWVNENIRLFGGNPDKVTIAGESAGGAAVMYQYISPLNKGLITNGVIAQSGNALSFFAIDKNPSESGKIIASRLNCSDVDNTTSILNCMREIPYEIFLKEAADMGSEDSANFVRTYAGISPVVEPKSVSGAFISEDPETLTKSGDVPNVPLIIGANLHDGSMIVGTEYLAKIGPQGLDNDPEYMKQQVVSDFINYAGIEDPNPENRVLASSFELAYLDGVNRTSWNESMPGLVDIATVCMFKSSAQHTAEILSGRGHNIYLYSNEHHSDNTLIWKLLGFEDLNFTLPVNHGVGHLDELLYLFDYNFTKYASDDATFGEVIVDMWLNFIKFGNPTPVSDARFDSWVPYDTVNEAYLKLNATPTLQHGYRNSWRPAGFN